jgi:radical SAM superfamily enzyme YgiQ (UPF0313 family)
MRKLLLILPRNERGLWGKVSKKGKTGFVRLSLPTLAALTPSDWDVEILDARATPVDFDKKVDLVGITGFSAEIPSAYEIADGFRKKGVKVVMGGIHVSALPEEALGHADSVVVGEAEPVWGEVLEDFENGAVKTIYRAKRPADMSGMPVPRRDLLKRSMYVACFNTIQATRGCPFDCDYCTVTEFFGKTFRTRPVEEVIDEIKGFDTRDFIFLDDNITGKPPYAKELFKALIPLKRTWGAQTSINLAKNEELLSLFGKSGGKYAYIGFETLTEKNLEKMNKSWNSMEDYRECIRRIQEAGINIIGSFIFGLDEDGTSVFKETLDFIKETGIDAAQFNVLTPLPGTRLYERLESEGRITDRDWAKYHLGEVVFEPRGMSAEELQQGYWWTYRKNYTIGNILRRVFRSPRGITYRMAINFTYRKKALRMPVVKHWKN